MDKQETIHNNKFAPNCLFAGAQGARGSRPELKGNCLRNPFHSLLRSLQQGPAVPHTWAGQSILPSWLKQQSFFSPNYMSGQHKSSLLQDRAAIEPLPSPAGCAGTELSLLYNSGK